MLRPRLPTIGEVLAFVVALSVGAATALIVHSLLLPEPWAPLGPYPTQVVKSQGPRVGSGDRNVQVPQVRIGADVEVTGQKCADETVTVEATIGWRSVEPAGFSHSESTGAPGTRLKGCSASLSFLNPMPLDVQEWALAQIGSGRSPVVYIGGCETPVRDNGGEGATLCWRTEPFLLVAP